MNKLVNERTLNIKTIGGLTETVADSADGSMCATFTFKEFLHWKTLFIHKEDENVFVPYHAVSYITEAIESKTIDVTDDTCVASGGDDPSDMYAILDENGTPLQAKNGITLLYRD